MSRVWGCVLLCLCLNATGALAALGARFAWHPASFPTWEGLGAHFVPTEVLDIEERGATASERVTLTPFTQVDQRYHLWPTPGSKSSWSFTGGEIAEVDRIYRNQITWWGTVGVVTDDPRNIQETIISSVHVTDMKTGTRQMMASREWGENSEFTFDGYCKFTPSPGDPTFPGNDELASAPYFQWACDPLDEIIGDGALTQTAPESWFPDGFVYQVFSCTYNNTETRYLSPADQVVGTTVAGRIAGHRQEWAEQIASEPPLTEDEIAQIALLNTIAPELDNVCTAENAQSWYSGTVPKAQCVQYGSCMRVANDESHIESDVGASDDPAAPAAVGGAIPNPFYAPPYTRKVLKIEITVDVIFQGDNERSSVDPALMNTNPFQLQTASVDEQLAELDALFPYGGLYAHDPAQTTDDQVTVVSYFVMDGLFVTPKQYEILNVSSILPNRTWTGKYAGPAWPEYFAEAAMPGNATMSEPGSLVLNMTFSAGFAITPGSMRMKLVGQDAVQRNYSFGMVQPNVHDQEFSNRSHTFLWFFLAPGSDTFSQGLTSVALEAELESTGHYSLQAVDGANLTGSFFEFGNYTVEFCFLAINGSEVCVYSDTVEYNEQLNLDLMPLVENGIVLEKFTCPNVGCTEPIGVSWNFTEDPAVCDSGVWLELANSGIHVTTSPEEPTVIDAVLAQLSTTCDNETEGSGFYNASALFLGYYYRARTFYYNASSPTDKVYFNSSVTEQYFVTWYANTTSCSDGKNDTIDDLHADLAACQANTSMWVALHAIALNASAACEAHVPWVKTTAKDDAFAWAIAGIVLIGLSILFVGRYPVFLSVWTTLMCCTRNHSGYRPLRRMWKAYFGLFVLFYATGVAVYTVGALHTSDHMARSVQGASDTHFRIALIVCGTLAAVGGTVLQAAAVFSGEGGISGDGGSLKWPATFWLSAATFVVTWGALGAISSQGKVFWAAVLCGASVAAFVVMFVGLAMLNQYEGKTGHPQAQFVVFLLCATALTLVCVALLKDTVYTEDYSV